MNDYQASRLVDILPPPAIATTSDHWTLYALGVIAITLALYFLLPRSERFRRYRLRRQIQQNTIDARHAAAQLMKLAGQQPDLHERLLQMRFGRQRPDADALLEILKRIP